STLFNFICSNNETSIEFDYESHLCDYVFNWYSNATCNPNTGKEASSKQPTVAPASVVPPAQASKPAEKQSPKTDSSSSFNSSDQDTLSKHSEGEKAALEQSAQHANST